MSPLVLVGYIDGAFGVRGELRVKAFTAALENIVASGPLRDRAGEVVLTPQRWRVIGDALAVTAPEVKTREEAAALKGVSLYAPRVAFPEAEEDEFYIIDLIGCAAEYASGERAGEVIAVHNFGAGDLLEIKPDDGAPFQIAFTKANAPLVDLAARRVVIDPPHVDSE